MNDPNFDWHEWRRQGIGSSDAPVIMKASPWMTPQELLDQKLGRAKPRPQTYPMRRGLALEPEARVKYEEMTGIPMPKDWLTHEEVEFVRGSFDGLNRTQKRVLEIKVPGKVDHMEARCKRIPKKYLWQCVHLCMVADFDSLDYFSYDWKAKAGVIVPFEREWKLEKKLLLAETDFWWRVLKDIPFQEKEPVSYSDDVFKVRRTR